MQLNQNEKIFGDNFFKLLEKHSLNDEQLFECLKVWYPKRFKNYSKKIIQIKEFDNIDSVNEFIKDKTLRGTGIYKISDLPYISSYMVIYYKESVSVKEVTKTDTPK